MKVVEFIVSLPQPGPLDIGPQVVQQRVQSGLQMLSEFLFSITNGFTYQTIVGAWRSEAGENGLPQIYQEPGLRFSVALQTDDNSSVVGKKNILKKFLANNLGPVWRQEAIFWQDGNEGEVLMCQPPVEQEPQEKPEGNIVVA